MARKFSKLSPWLWVLFAIIGPICLVVIWYRGRPQQVIRKVLLARGVPESTVKQWIAVSAFETAGWTSKVFRDSNNLFNLIVPGSNKLQYGEGQTIFPDYKTAAIALYDRVLKPFKYPLSFDSIENQVTTMKEKGYFTSGVSNYIAGVKAWFNKLFL